MGTLALYTIRTTPHGAGTWLHVADEGDAALDELSETLGALTEPGRIARAPVEVAFAAELEGQEAHYGDAEIAASMTGVPLPYRSLGNGCALVDEVFVAALEAIGAQLRALPVTQVHPATHRRWDAWLIAFPAERYLPALRDDREPVVVDRESRTIAYYNTAARDAIAALGWPWLAFMRHDVPRCEAAPAGDGEDADRALLAALGALFAAKQPRARPGSAYGADYFVDRLLVRYADASGPRLRAAIDRAPDAAIYYELAGDLVDGFGVRPDSPLGQKLAKR
jgi:hypothetical protein